MIWKFRAKANNAAPSNVHGSQSFRSDKALRYVKTTAAITQGGTITPGSNCEAVTVGEELKDLRDEIDAIPSSTALSLTLAAGSWSSATPPTQTLTATGVRATSNIIVGIGSSVTGTQYEQAAAAMIVCTAQGTDEITLTCYGEEPSGNIPISVMILP